MVRFAAMASNSNNTFNYCPKCDGKLNTRLLCYSCGFTAKESDKYIKVVPDHTKRWYDKPWILTGHYKYADTPKEELLGLLWVLKVCAFCVILGVLYTWVKSWFDG